MTDKTRDLGKLHFDAVCKQSACGQYFDLSSQDLLHVTAWHLPCFLPYIAKKHLDGIFSPLSTFLGNYFVYNLAMKQSSSMGVWERKLAVLWLTDSDTHPL